MNASSVAVVIIFYPGKEDQESYRIAGPNIFSHKINAGYCLLPSFLLCVKSITYLFKTYIIVDSIIRNKIIPINIIGLIEAQPYCITLLFLC